jgi:hypothetical protein
MGGAGLEPMQPVRRQGEDLARGTSPPSGEEELKRDQRAEVTGRRVRGSWLTRLLARIQRR